MGGEVLRRDIKEKLRKIEKSWESGMGSQLMINEFDHSNFIF